MIPLYCLEPGDVFGPINGEMFRVLCFIGTDKALARHIEHDGTMGDVRAFHARAEVNHARFYDAQFRKV